MKKITKISIIVIVVSALVGLGLSFILNSKENPTNAQELSDTGPLLQNSATDALIRCRRPIPIGNTAYYLYDILNKTYENIKDSESYVDLSIDHTRKMVAELTMYPNTICDYSKCDARLQTVDLGPTINLNLKPGNTTLLGFCAPFCQPLECGGDPCPGFEDNIESTQDSIDQINSSWEAIRDIFTDEKVPLTDDIRMDGEDRNQDITELERVKRYLKLSREWLHPGPAHQAKSCVLTNTERSRAARGEIGDRYPMSCTEALDQNLYWPEPWSESCSDVCRGTVTNECLECLGGEENNSEHASPIAKVNYKIYNTCETECENGYTPQCEACICTDSSGNPLTESQCTAFICGGSERNWVCCSETPLE